MAGDAEAMVRVSHMLMAGYGTQQDHTAAARWMRQAWWVLDMRTNRLPCVLILPNQQQI
jgi:TPR repeat protein